MAAPTVTSVNPNNAVPGVQVRIVGADLGSVTKVIFGGGVEGRIEGHSALYILVRVPEGARSGVITLESPDGNVQTENFTVLAPIEPPITRRAADISGSKKFNWGVVLGGIALVLGLVLLVWKATDSSPDLSPYATTASVDEKLANKGDKAEVEKLNSALNDSEKGLIVLSNQLADKVNDPKKGLEALARKLEGKADQTDLDALQTVVDTKITAEQATALYEQACAEREAKRKEWWKKHGKTVIAKRETEKLQEREALKLEIIKELQRVTTVTGLPEGDPAAIVVEVAPNGGTTQRAVIPRVMTPAPEPKNP